MKPVARVPNGHFESLFWTENARRDNFRSRLFGMFSEEIVRTWGQCEHAPYRDLGRPTLWRGASRFTLDFVLERKADSRRFVAEQKAELAWAGYSQLRLVSASQLASHVGKPAFDWFLDLARDPESSVVKVAARPVAVEGAVLVWGSATEQGKADAMRRYGLQDVLSLEEMIQDLRAWKDTRWQAHVAELRDWTNGLLDGLAEATVGVGA